MLLNNWLHCQLGKKSFHGSVCVCDGNTWKDLYFLVHARKLKVTEGWVINWSRGNVLPFSEQHSPKFQCLKLEELLPPFPLCHFYFFLYYTHKKRTFKWLNNTFACCKPTEIIWRSGQISAWLSVLLWDLYLCLELRSSRLKEYLGGFLTRQEIWINQTGLLLVAAHKKTSLH